MIRPSPPTNVADCLPARAAVDDRTAAANPALAIYQTAGTGDLAECPWPSVHASAGHASVIANGDQDDVATLANLPDGKYLISVTAAGFKIDGIHFAVAGGAVASVNEEPNKPFIVRMNPLPKKTLTIRVHVFNDNASTNGQWDGQTETLLTCEVAEATRPHRSNWPTVATRTTRCWSPIPTTDMSGFGVSIADVLDTTTTDVFGNALCTQYETDGFGNVILGDDGSPIPLDVPRWRRHRWSPVGYRVDLHLRSLRRHRHPQHGPEPLRRDGRSAGSPHAQRRGVDPHHHARRRPRLGLVEHRRRQRLRHRADRRRRARSSRDRRLRQAEQHRRHMGCGPSCRNQLAG